MTWIDWLFVALPLLLVFGVALYTHRFVKSVADFLSGGRCARRYLLANARGESDSGLANTMSKFEIIMVSGFVLNFWDKLTVPILLLFGISGFVVYRFRETRALTLAQFLEARYSRGFRLFMGGLAFVSGVLNYGIFPAVSARFFIYFLDLPHYFEFGHVTFSTFAVIMFGYLSATVFMILVGGQVTAMVTDCIEGILSHAAYIVIVICVFYLVGWHHIVETMSAPPPGKSMINPFDAKDVEDFNVWYAVMALMLSAYGTMAFQNRQGFNSAAKTPHESRMGGVLGHWRNYARGLMLLMLGLCAVTYLRHPELQQASESARQAIGTVKDAYIQKQMTVPIALSYLLPVGIKGLFVAIMVMGLLAGDAGHIHSWGSIFVQDVILPLKKKPMTPAGHILALRLSVIGVAAFALGFSIVFSQSQYITLWMALSASVFVAGAGVAIIGGLYSKRGTAAGAWAGAITGCTLSLIGVALTTKNVWPIVARALTNLGMQAPAKFWLNGQQVAFVAAGSAVAVYVIVSLATGRGRRFDLDAMLHRTPNTKPKRRFSLASALKFDSNFSRSDRWVSGGIFFWSMILLAVNLVVSTLNLRAWYPATAPMSGWVQSHWLEPWGAWGWAHYWAITAIGVPFAIALVTFIWFGIGGAFDIIDFFRTLKSLKRDANDDGRVIATPSALAALEIAPTSATQSASSLSPPAEPASKT